MWIPDPQQCWIFWWKIIASSGISLYFHISVCRLGGSRFYRGHQRLVAPWPRPHSCQKHSATRSCGQRWTPAVRRPHPGGKEAYEAERGGEEKVTTVMCLDQRHRRHRREPGRTGVYAAQHPAGRERVSGGAPAGRHVPTPRDGKNHSPRSVVSARRKILFGLIGLCVFLQQREGEDINFRFIFI